MAAASETAALDQQPVAAGAGETAAVDQQPVMTLMTTAVSGETTDVDQRHDLVTLSS